MLADAVGADGDVAGRHGQALFAAAGELLLAQVLPRSPARDTGRYSRIPDAMPLAVQHAPDIAYLAVVICRERLPEADGDEYVPTEVQQDDSIAAYLQPGHWPTSAVAPEPLASYGHPADEWQHAAGQVTNAVE
ncbi:hypothetical protein [Streptomyces mexicanus]|uniref:Uncharacterized protein n=1 Tax=Streptomyces mexicanus TaxID=178566 RepID=A0A7X1LTG0_9ACTN|nr:hypothetical protein [Streptomyces mexicanus]MBC2868717.1 hypothetical protein [Streptomyces mexicanus]